MFCRFISIQNGAWTNAHAYLQQNLPVWNPRNLNFISTHFLFLFRFLLLLLFIYLFVFNLIENFPFKNIERRYFVV